MLISKKKHEKIVRELELSRDFYKGMFFSSAKIGTALIIDALDRIEIAYKELELNWRESNDR